VIPSREPCDDYNYQTGGTGKAKEHLAEFKPKKPKPAADFVYFVSREMDNSLVLFHVKHSLLLGYFVGYSLLLGSAGLVVFVLTRVPVPQHALLAEAAVIGIAEFARLRT
jgi:hypothetical protein